MHKGSASAVARDLGVSKSRVRGRAQDLGGEVSDFRESGVWRRRRLLELAKKYNGNISAIARTLGRSRPWVRRHTLKLGVELNEFRPPPRKARGLVMPERERFEDLARLYQGNVSAISRDLGTARVQVRRYADRLGVDLADYRPSARRGGELEDEE